MPHLVDNDILIPEMDSLLRGGQQVVFTPGGVSMRPFIEGGRDSVMLERPTSAHPCRVGDILLCHVGQRYVLHRLIALQEDHLTLMGDGNLRGCEQCSLADVVGRVVWIRSPKGCRKPKGSGRLWRMLLPWRGWLLKVYRHTPRVL